MKCYIELTSRCNLKCIHCFNECKKDYVLDKDLLIKQFQYFKMLGLNEVQLSGGEPLMHPNFFEFVDALNDLDMNIRIFTNLLLWEKEHFEKIKNAKNIFINTSLEGANKENDDFIRGAGHFEKFTKKINLLKENGIEKCIVHCTLNKYNCSEIEQYVNLVNSWGCIPLFSFIEVRGNAKIHKDELEMSNRQIFRSIVDIKRLIKDDLGVVGEEYRSQYCPINAKRYNLLIKSNGDVTICNLIYDDIAIVGNIYDSDINEIILGEKYISLLNKLKKLEIGSCDECIKQIAKLHK